MWSPVIGWQGKKDNFFIMFICPDKSYSRNRRVRLKFSITLADLGFLSDSEFPTLLDFLSESFCLLRSMYKNLKNLFFPHEVTGELNQSSFYIKSYTQGTGFLVVSPTTTPESHFDPGLFC